MTAPFDAACGEPVHRLEPCPSCGEIIEDGYCQNCRDIAPARKADDLRPDLRERVEEWKRRVGQYEIALGTWDSACEAVESLARDLQRAEAERAECARLLLLRETEIEEGDAAYRIVADQLAACRLARQCGEYDLAAARAECEKADDFGTRAELARLKLAGELAAVEAAHAMANRTNAALLGQRTALRDRLARVQRLFDESGAGHSRRCVEMGDIAFDLDCAYCKALALLAEEAR